MRKAWEEVRGDGDVDWLIAGFDRNSKTDVTVLSKGSGGIDGCSIALPENKAVFGGCRLSTGRFVTFFYADEGTPTMQKGRASMYKNGVLNVLQGSDCEINMKPGLTENETILSVVSDSGDGRINSWRSDKSLPKKTSTTTTTTGTTTSKYSKNISQSLSATVVSDPPTTISKEEVPKHAILPLSEQSTNNDCDTSPAFTTCVIVPYGDIKDIQDPSLLPAGVNPLNRELSLSDDEFVTIFGMNKSKFSTLPKWKQTSHKKAKGLF